MVREHYEQRCQQYAAEVARAELQSDRLSVLRAALFFPAATCFFLGWWGGGLVAWYALGAILSVGFLGAVAFHEQVVARIHRWRVLREINAAGIARLDRNWSHLPGSAVEISDDDWGTCHDLDLFGEASLFKLLRTASTPAGIRTLRDWLLHPATPEVIVERQTAVRALGPQLEWRQALELEARLLEDRGDSVARFLKWVEGPEWLAPRTWLVVLVRLLPLFIFIAATALALQWVTVEVGIIAIAGLLLSNVLILVLFAGKVHDLFQQIHHDGDQVRRYFALFSLIEALPRDVPGLRSIQSETLEIGGGVGNQFRRLQRITTLATFPRSSLFFVFLYLPLQFLILYDFHILMLYEAWQRANRERMRGWFDALGRLESLASLAALHHDHPEWVFPEVRHDVDCIEAKQVGHPLLRDDRCVRNDVTVGPLPEVLDQVAAQGHVDHLVAAADGEQRHAGLDDRADQRQRRRIAGRRGRSGDGIVRELTSRIRRASAHERSKRPKQHNLFHTSLSRSASRTFA
mgnify:CR=1 FL=1